MWTLGPLTLRILIMGDFALLQTVFRTIVKVHIYDKNIFKNQVIFLSDCFLCCLDFCVTDSQTSLL